MNYNETLGILEIERYFKHGGKGLVTLHLSSVSAVGEKAEEQQYGNSFIISAGMIFAVDETYEQLADIFTRYHISTRRDSEIKIMVDGHLLEPLKRQDKSKDGETNG